MVATNQQILITGANGLVGSALLEGLITSFPNIRIRALVRKMPLRPHGNVEYVRGDLRETIELDLYGGDTILMHFAHLHRGSLEEMKATNVMGLHRLLEAGGSRIKKVFLGSSMSVYGQGPFQGVSESAPLNPQTPLALTRMEAENVVRDFCSSHQSNFHIFRPRFLFDIKEKETMPKLHTQFKKGVMIGSGEQRYSFIHVRDYVKIILHCLAREESDILNIAYPQSISLKEMYQYFGNFHHRVSIPVKLLIAFAPILGLNALKIKLQLTGLDQVLDTMKLTQLYPEIERIDAHSLVRELAQNLQEAKR